MLWNLSPLVQAISLAVAGNLDKRLIKKEFLNCCFFGKRFLEKWDNKWFFVLFFVFVRDIRMLNVQHFYFLLLSAPFRYFQNSGHRQLPGSLVLIATASSVLSAQVKSSSGSVKAPDFRLQALVSLIPAVQSSSSQPASHLEHLSVLKSRRRRRSLICHVPTWVMDGRRMCDDALSQQSFL